MRKCLLSSGWDDAYDWSYNCYITWLGRMEGTKSDELYVCGKGCDESVVRRFWFTDDWEMYV